MDQAFQLCALALLFAAQSARAYVETVTPNGQPIRIRDEIKLNLAGNPKNRSGLAEQDFRDAVVRGLQRWKAASRGAIGFDYWQGTDPAIYETNSDYDGLSTIYFSSQSGTPLSSNVLGLTQVWYNAENGQLLESDIALNDVDYQFTTDPRDTSGYGVAGSNHPGRAVFVENVITHELGHAFGLSHSAAMQSTMLFMESPEQAFLGCDDQAAIRALYPPNSASGAISGTIVSPQGSPVFGAHVVAVSRRRGVALATTITDASGFYSIGGLEPGAYFLLAEPYYAGPDVLPSYFSAISARVCPSGNFARTILESAPNQPVVVQVAAGTHASAPLFRVGCSSEGEAIVPMDRDSQSIARAPEIFSGTSGEFGRVNRFDWSNVLYYRLTGISGHVEAVVMGYSLYSPLHASVSLLSANGAEVSMAEKEDPIYSGVSGYQNRDSRVVAENLPRGDYLLRIEETPLKGPEFPAGPLAIDSAPFVVVTGSVGESEPSQLFPDNARCKMSELFPPYASPPGDPIRRALLDEKSSGGCAMIPLQISSRRSGGGGVGMAAIFGWFLPWIALAIFRAIILRVLRRKANLYEGLAAGRTGAAVAVSKFQ